MFLGFLSKQGCQLNFLRTEHLSAEICAFVKTSLDFFLGRTTSPMALAEGETLFPGKSMNSLLSQDITFDNRVASTTFLTFVLSNVAA